MSSYALQLTDTVSTSLNLIVGHGCIGLFVLRINVRNEFFFNSPVQVAMRRVDAKDNIDGLDAEFCENEGAGCDI